MASAAARAVYLAILSRAGTRASRSRPRHAELLHFWRLGVPIESAASPPDFGPVSSDEMAFALTLFVEAANRRISLPVRPEEASLEDEDEVCECLYRALCADVVRLPAAAAPEADDHTTLYAAFCALCRYYDGDPLQAAVCARVLAFYFLMERTAGAALSPWIQPHSESVQLVELHPAVVEAIATTRLDGSVLLPEEMFVEVVAEKARSMVKRLH